MSGKFDAYESVLKPLLFRLDPEVAHQVAMTFLRVTPPALLRWLFPSPHDAKLEREVFGLKFPNPIGLAAGFDKNAVALPAWEALGFGFVEAGTITAHPQPGNPKPRIFRYPEQQALINRMGFNNDGAEAVAARLETLKRSGRWPKIPVGLNLGKSKITPLENSADDYVRSFKKLAPFADYLVLNVSSPNTPGLRELQSKPALDDLLGTVQIANVSLPVPKPVLVKLSPDLETAQLEEVIALAENHRLAGFVVTNTTLDRSSIPKEQNQEGGLSGRPLRARASKMLSFVTSKTAKPVIAAGGISDIAAAREKLDAGAALIQLYTGFVYRGPSLLSELIFDLRRTSS